MRYLRLQIAYRQTHSILYVLSFLSQRCRPTDLVVFNKIYIYILELRDNCFIYLDR